MKITFKVGYNTAWGENLFISGNIPELGNGREEDAVAMASGAWKWMCPLKLRNSVIPIL